jgi:hypothetical protein
MQVTDEAADGQLQSFDSNAMPWGELGLATPAPTAPCARGHPEDARGHVRPGQLVWFPEGMLMEHGATEDGDVTTLFITNKPFDEQDGSDGRSSI